LYARTIQRSNGLSILAHHTINATVIELPHNANGTLRISRYDDGGYRQILKLLMMGKSPDVLESREEMTRDDHVK
jgi:hypothetical protein